MTTTNELEDQLLRVINNQHMVLERAAAQFESILCLASEGPEVMSHAPLFEEICSEASEGLAMCRELIEDDD